MPLQTSLPDKLRRNLFSLAAAILSFSLPACISSPMSTGVPAASASPSLQPSLPTVLPTFTPEPSSTPTPPGIWIDPALSDQMSELISIPEKFKSAPSARSAQLTIGYEGEFLLGYWTLALTTSFDSLQETMEFQDLMKLWQGDTLDKAASPSTLYIDTQTHRMLAAVWGNPANENIQILSHGEDHLDVVDHEDYLGLVPFQDLSPRLKVVSVAGQKPFWPSYNPADNPLSIPVYVSGEQSAAGSVLAKNPNWGNVHRDQLTSLAMTGVTAMVRATGYTMDQKGILYPARDIQPIFERVDLTHISNEVPFAEDCPDPELEQPSLYFCSPDRYLELLKYIGTDIVELTGDHFGDWGPEAMLYTLERYKQLDWLTYGGGRNLQEGLEPVTLSHHGNRLAFIGCNAKGGKYATATDQTPGSSECDFEWMTARISNLSSEGYLVIATMQHEEYYSYQANYLQIRDFRRLAEAGASVVSGSQAHQPQTMEFHAGAFIHYGLGNLFFDQFRVAKYVEQFKHTNQAFIDIHYFYRNRHLSTELQTIKFVDFARSVPMSSGEHRELLEAVFSASPR